MKVQGFKPVPKTVDSEMGTITHEGLVHLTYTAACQNIYIKHAYMGGRVKEKKAAQNQQSDASTDGWPSAHCVSENAPQRGATEGLA